MRTYIVTLLLLTALNASLAWGQETAGLSWDAVNKKQVIGNTTYRFTEYRPQAGHDMPALSQAIATAMTDSLLFSSESKAEQYQRIARNYLKAKDTYIRTGAVPHMAQAGGAFDIGRVRWETEERGGGFWVGAGGTMIAGPTRSLMGPIGSLQVSLETFRGNSSLLLDFTLGYGYYPGHYSNVIALIGNGKVAPYYSLSGCFSYRIHTSGRTLLALFAVAGYSSLGIKNTQGFEWKSILHGPAATEGIAFDVLSARQKVDFRGSRHVFSRGGLRIKLYSSQILNFPQRSFIPTLNLGAGFVFSSKNVVRSND